MISKNTNLFEGLLTEFQCYYIHKTYVVYRDCEHVGNYLSLQFAIAGVKNK